MKLTKQQIVKIIQEELQESSCGGPARRDMNNIAQMQEKAMDIVAAMQPEELAELLQSPIMQMVFQRLMGMGKY